MGGPEIKTTPTCPPIYLPNIGLDFSGNKKSR